MLSTPTPFPQVGSTGFYRGTLDPMKIVRRNADGTLLVQRLMRRHNDTIDATRAASGNCTIEAADLFETEQQARWPQGKPKGRAGRKPARAARTRKLEQA